MTYILDRHIPRFVGSIYYVDATNGSNDYSGLSPTQAKATITAAITDAADTYITLRLSAALASGAMLWACRYEPLTADGFLEPA